MDCLPPSCLLRCYSGIEQPLMMIIVSVLPTCMTAYNTPGRLLRRQILMLLRMLLCLYRQQGSSFNSMVTEVPQNHRAGSKTMLLTPNGVAGCCYPRPCMTWPQ
eukprot:scaffold110505_cov20-Tisochrysis_lutea.AAC.3